MKSIIQFFEESVDKFGSNVYLWEKPMDKYEGTTYEETKIQALEFAAGLISLGIKKGDRLSLISEGRNSWVIGELGILYAGAMNVPLSTKLNAAEVKFRLNHSDSRMVLTSNIQFEKIKQVIDDCPLIEKIIHLDTRAPESANARPRLRVVMVLPSCGSALVTRMLVSSRSTAKYWRLERTARNASRVGE